MDIAAPSLSGGRPGGHRPAVFLVRTDRRESRWWRWLAGRFRPILHVEKEWLGCVARDRSRDGSATYRDPLLFPSSSRYGSARDPENEPTTQKSGSGHATDAARSR